ncbi:MAG: hypothetical protein ACLT98_13335 [Eggerthellaceae bacterium]
MHPDLERSTFRVRSTIAHRPVLIVLAVVAAIVYIVAAWRYSPNRAKSCSQDIHGYHGRRFGVLLLVRHAWLERSRPCSICRSAFLTALIGLRRRGYAARCFAPQPAYHQGRERRLRVPGVGGRNRKTLLRGFEMRWRRAGVEAQTPFGGVLA